MPLPTPGPPAQNLLGFGPAGQLLGMGAICDELRCASAIEWWGAASVHAQSVATKMPCAARMWLPTSLRMFCLDHTCHYGTPPGREEEGHG
jgi:hypothetical protein